MLKDTPAQSDTYLYSARTDGREGGGGGGFTSPREILLQNKAAIQPAQGKIHYLIVQTGICVRVVVMFYWAENYFVPLVSSRRKQMPESFINTEIRTCNQQSNEK